MQKRFITSIGVVIRANEVFQHACRLGGHLVHSMLVAKGGLNVAVPQAIHDLGDGDTGCHQVRGTGVADVVCAWVPADSGFFDCLAPDAVPLVVRQVPCGVDGPDAGFL